MPRKTTTKNKKIENELQALITIAEELINIRRELESLNTQIGMRNSYM